MGIPLKVLVESPSHAQFPMKSLGSDSWPSSGRLSQLSSISILKPPNVPSKCPVKWSSSDEAAEPVLKEDWQFSLGA
jgi:hypothetical protein